MKKPFVYPVVLAVGLCLTMTGAIDSHERAPVSMAAASTGEAPIYVVYYWRARPDRVREYGAYIRDVAEPIDEEARRAGVFEEVRTFTPAMITGAPGADWTHMRVFRLSDYAALDTFSAGLEAATRRLYPDEGSRPKSDGLRDLVRQEIWREFH